MLHSRDVSPLLATLLLALLAAVHAADASAKPPNILCILADDLGIGDLQCYGNPDIETPAINSLARDGVLFTDHEAPSPLATAHPGIVATLTRQHDSWFDEVFTEWQRSRASIVAHDRAYWRGRVAPDPRELFDGFWQWSRAPRGTDPRTADPLQTFRGYWTAADVEQ